MVKSLSPKAIKEFFQRLQARNPDPKTELKYSSHFELLIAVILSAQATDASVNKATKILFSLANTPEAIFRLGESGLQTYIKAIGLYRTKAKNIIKTCEILSNDYNSEVPCNRKQLEQLPGVGRKTANVILNTAFGESTIAVDTHIFRTANRTGLARGASVRQVEDQLLKVIPNEYLYHAHHWLILHGRYTCLARRPKCGTCTVYDLCLYPDKVTTQ